MSLFGVIVSGRLVQTDFNTVTNNKFLIHIPEPDKINHIVIFMTGVQAFPAGLGGSVYFNYPNADGTGSWQYLGYITNEKPSAIFKISKHTEAAGVTHAFSSFSNTNATVAQIGISVESLTEIEFQNCSNSCQKAISSDTYHQFCQKMLESFYNYASSFAMNVPGSRESYFPMKTLEQWYENFRRKLQNNPNFWKS